MPKKFLTVVACTVSHISLDDNTGIQWDSFGFFQVYDSLVVSPLDFVGFAQVLDGKHLVFDSMCFPFMSPKSCYLSFDSIYDSHIKAIFCVEGIKNLMLYS